MKLKSQCNTTTLNRGQNNYFIDFFKTWLRAHGFHQVTWQRYSESPSNIFPATTVIMFGSVKETIQWRNEIPLPGKKAREIKELILIIYPIKSGNAWKTANEIQTATSVETRRWVSEDIHADILVVLVSEKPGYTILADLSFAQFFKLEKLLGTIVNRARQLKLSEFKSHEMYDRMDPSIYKQIAEGMIERLEKRASSGYQAMNHYPTKISDVDYIRHHKKWSIILYILNKVLLWLG